MNQLYFDATQFDLRYAMEPTPLFEQVPSAASKDERRALIFSVWTTAAKDKSIGNDVYQMIYAAGGWE